MIDELKPYPGYQDSGKPWLGPVPSHWQTIRAKHLYRESDERSMTGEEMLCSVSHTTGVTPRKANVTMFQAESTIGHKLCRPDDLVINTLWAWMAAMGVAKQIGLVSPAYGVYRPLPASNLLPAFADRLLRIPQYKSQYMALSTGINASRLRLYPDQFLRLPVLLPPPAEQAAIVRFLEAVDRKVNRFIRAKRRLIEVLTEQKQAIITHAVTRGLNPHAKLKPSGIDWLGDVPEHWRVLPLKRWVSTKITDGPHETPPLRDNGIDFVSAEAMVNGKIVFARRRGFITRELHEVYCQKCRPQRDDIFMCKSGNTTGKVAMVNTDQEFSVWSPLALIRCKRNWVVPQLMFLVLASNYAQQQVQDRWSYGTQPNLSMAAMERIVVAMPDNLDEQRALIASIQAKTGVIDATIERALHEIDLIREYRTRLVADVVTGKLDVRGVPLPADAAGPEEIQTSDPEDAEEPAEDDSPEDIAETTSADA